MTLNEHGLRAFAHLAKTGSFSKAAVAIGVTQPALSIRIRELERELGTVLVKRMRGGISLTESGKELLRFYQVKADLERELFAKISTSDRSSFGGSIRIAGSSSVMRPIVFKALGPFIRKHPRVELEFYVRELVELEPMLHRGETDFILVNTKAGNQKQEALLLGYENIVVVEHKKYRDRDDVFLDADPKDLFTEKFLQAQKKSQQYRRSFLQDEFGIHEGVGLGFGRAVVHAHMIPKGLPIRIASGFEPYREPVVLHYVRQPYYSELHKAVVRELESGAKKFL